MACFCLGEQRVFLVAMMFYSITIVSFKSSISYLLRSTLVQPFSSQWKFIYNIQPRKSAQVTP